MVASCALYLNAQQAASASVQNYVGAFVVARGLRYAETAIGCLDHEHHLVNIAAVLVVFHFTLSVTGTASVLGVGLGLAATVRACVLPYSLTSPAARLETARTVRTERLSSLDFGRIQPW